MALKDTHQIDKETEEVVDPLLQYVYERYNLVFLFSSLMAITAWPQQCIHTLPSGVFFSINDLPRSLYFTWFLPPAIQAICCLYLEARVLLCVNFLLLSLDVLTSWAFIPREICWKGSNNCLGLDNVCVWALQWSRFDFSQLCWKVTGSNPGRVIL